jgi:hypothetical protein
MSSGGFDFQSALRIARTVLDHEQALPVGTKRVRRPPVAQPGAELLLVRLLEDIPPADLLPPEDQPDDFYELLHAAMNSDNLGDVNPSELLSYLQTKSFETTVGSGLAVTCKLDDLGRNVNGTQGQSINVRLTYSEVVTVYNMHPNGFNTINVGGVAGNEAGSLGAGFCNAMQGDDGRLWLVSPDRKLLVRALDAVDNLQFRISAIEFVAAHLREQMQRVYMELGLVYVP